MTIEQLVSAIRALPVTERLRVLELATHDVANDLSHGAPQPASGVGVTLIERHGLLVAHGEPGATLPEAAFDRTPLKDSPQTRC